MTANLSQPADCRKLAACVACCVSFPENECGLNNCLLSNCSITFDVGSVNVLAEPSRLTVMRRAVSIENETLPLLELFAGERLVHLVLRGRPVFI